MNLSGLTDRWELLAGIGSALVSFAGWWIQKRRTPEASSWLSRRLNVEKDLLIAHRTIKSQESEISYLAAALQRAQAAAELVQKVVTISGLKSAKPSDDSTTFPTGSKPRSVRSSRSRQPPGTP